VLEENWWKLPGSEVLEPVKKRDRSLRKIYAKWERHDLSMTIYLFYLAIEEPSLICKALSLIGDLKVNYIIICFVSNALTFILNALTFVLNALIFVLNALTFVLNALMFVLNALTFVLNALTFVLNAFMVQLDKFFEVGLCWPYR